MSPAAWKSDEATLLALLAAFRANCFACCEAGVMNAAHLCAQHSAALAEQRFLDGVLELRWRVRREAGPRQARRTRRV